MVNENAESLSEKYPSLELAYEQVKDVLTLQQNASSSLDAKASTMIAVGTAVFGVGVSLGFSRVLNTHLLFVAYLLLLVATAIPVYYYFRVWGLARRVLKLKGFVTLNHPRTIRKLYWRLPKDKFIHAILVHTEQSWKENDRKLQEKAKLVDKLLATTFWETFIVVVWVAVIILVTSYLN